MFDLRPLRKHSGRDLVGFKSEMDNLFNRFFESELPLSRGILKEGQWAPRMDVSVDEKNITVQVEIPGCDAKDIDVSLDGRMLTIKGEKKDEKEEKDKNYLRVERTHGIFSRTIELPSDVDQDDVEATYKKGVLKLTLNKAAPATGKTIEIKTS